MNLLVSDISAEIVDISREIGELAFVVRCTSYMYQILISKIYDSYRTSL